MTSIYVDLKVGKSDPLYGEDPSKRTSDINLGMIMNDELNSGQKWRAI